MKILPTLIAMVALANLRGVLEPGALGRIHWLWFRAFTMPASIFVDERQSTDCHYGYGDNTLTSQRDAGQSGFQSVVDNDSRSWTLGAMKRIYIMGMNGQIARPVLQYTLEKTDDHLTPYLRNASRIEQVEASRETVNEGNVNNADLLTQLIARQDMVNGTGGIFSPCPDMQL